METAMGMVMNMVQMDVCAPDALLDISTTTNFPKWRDPIVPDWVNPVKMRIHPCLPYRDQQLMYR